MNKKIIIIGIVLTAVLVLIPVVFHKKSPGLPNVGGVSESIPNGVNVQVKFTIGTYSDALNLTQKEYSTYTPDQINQMEKDKYNTWATSVIQASKDHPKPTKVQVQAQIDDLQSQIDALKAQL